MVPETVLETCRKAYGKAPLAFALAVRGDKFEMGEGLSSAAKQNMKEAEKFLSVSELIQTGRPNSLLHRGGRIEAESALVKSSKFTVWLPTA